MGQSTPDRARHLTMLAGLVFISLIFLASTLTNSDKCSPNSLHMSDTDCSVFYHCSMYGKPITKSCGELMFNHKDKVCDWPANVMKYRSECDPGMQAAPKQSKNDSEESFKFPKATKERKGQRKLSIQEDGQNVKLESNFKMPFVPGIQQPQFTSQVSDRSKESMQTLRNSREEKEITDLSSAISPFCSPGWIPASNSKCFSLSGKVVASSWSDARSRCTRLKQGAELASVEDQYQLNVVLGSSDLVTPCFIGASDAGSEGRWKWVDGSLWTWGKEENKGNKEQNCLEMRVITNMQGINLTAWAGVECDKVLPRSFICSYKRVLVQPPHQSPYPPCTLTVCPTMWNLKQISQPVRQQEMFDRLYQ